MKTILTAVGVILVFLGLVFLIGGRPWTGAVILAVGGFLIVVGLRDPRTKNVVIRREIELSGDVDLQEMKCRSCGGSLSSDNISFRAGTLFVSCPYCHSEYQMEEAPKW